MKEVPLGLKPGDDLRRELEAWMGQQQGQAGRVIGGQGCAGSLVRTTAELVIGLLPDWRFNRELDPASGDAELRIRLRAQQLHQILRTQDELGVGGRAGPVWTVFAIREWRSQFIGDRRHGPRTGRSSGPIRPPRTSRSAPGISNQGLSEGSCTVTELPNGPTER